jgi:23S rRNA (pseudouridine1915-N3)-methyltransferase
LRVVIVAVGRAKLAAYCALLEEYYGRIRRYSTLDEIEVRDGPADRVTAAFQKVMTGIGTRAELVVMDVAGERLSSEGFARRLGDTLDRAVVPVFAIGGAEGLPPALRSRAAWKLSLGPMTLPHRLARVVLAEQIYRAFTIMRGEPYAREG